MTALANKMRALQARMTKGPWTPGRFDMISETMDGKMFKNIYAKDDRGGVHMGESLPLIVARAEREFDSVSLDEVFANTAALSLADELPALVIALEECADEAAEWINNHYTAEVRKYPSEQRRYDRDIAPVNNARAILKRISERLT